jgi:hypothetical protein
VCPEEETADLFWVLLGWPALEVSTKEMVLETTALG